MKKERLLKPFIDGLKYDSIYSVLKNIFFLLSRFNGNYKEEK